MYQVQVSEGAHGYTKKEHTVLWGEGQLRRVCCSLRKSLLTRSPRIHVTPPPPNTHTTTTTTTMEAGSREAYKI